MIKRIYSINLTAFLYMILKTFPKVYKDDEGLTYFVYEDSNEVALLINMYKNTKVQVELHEYLAAYRDIRVLMKTVR